MSSVGLEIQVAPRAYPTKSFNQALNRAIREQDGYKFYIAEVSHNFMTCDGNTEYMGFSFYTKPFQDTLWITILVVFTVLTLLLRFIFLRFKIKDNSALFFVRILIEQDMCLSNKLMQLGNSFKILIIIFLLVGIVLTNGYKGIVTSNLTAPLPSTKMEKILNAALGGYSILIPFPERVNRYEHGKKMGTNLTHYVLQSL